MSSLTLSFPQLLILLGAVQGFFLAGVLVTKRTNRPANRLLAVLMLAFSLHLVSSVYYGAGLVPVFPHFFGVAYLLPLVYGPLVYLYAVTVSDRTRRLSRRDALHFALFGAALLVTSPVYLQSGAEKVEFYNRLIAGKAPAWMIVTDWLKYVSGIGYTVASITFLRKHRRTVMDSYSSVEGVNLQWLLWIIGAAALTWSLATAFQLSEVFWTRFEHADEIVSLLMAIMVYGSGYFGLRQPEVFNYATAEYPIPRLEVAQAALTAAAPETEGPRYEKSGLAAGEAEAIRDALLLVMDKERPYQKSELTLADLAGRLNTTPHKLSEVLSQTVGTTFYDFVNKYRVEDVQRRVADAGSRNLTLLALALDAGFASKSTFNNVFKRHTGVTPSEYRKALAS